MFIFKQVDNPFEVAKIINHLLKDIPRKQKQEKEEKKSFLENLENL